MEALDHLQHEVDRFTTLLTDLLEISRVEAGVAELLLEEVEPRAFVAEVLASMERQGLSIVEERGAPDRVRLDPRRMGQVVVNLVQNADNYGGGATEVRLGGDAGHLRIVVDDAGPGIPPEQREQVFERFVRGDDPSVPGTGLGLALVREHVRLHEGTVVIKRSPAGGARFVVTIPKAMP